MKYKSFISFFATTIFAAICLIHPAYSFAGSTKLTTAAVKRFHIKEALADSNTWQLAKDIYLDKPWKLSNENGQLLLTIVDSFSKMDKAVQGFYFVVIAKSKDKSDGFYSEGLGAAGKDYIDTHLLEFLNYFIGHGKLSPVYLDKYADIYWLEQAIVSDNDSIEIQRALRDDYLKKKKQCTTEKQQKLLEDFSMDLSVAALIAKDRRLIVPIYQKGKSSSPKK